MEWSGFEPLVVRVHVRARVCVPAQYLIVIELVVVAQRNDKRVLLFGAQPQQEPAIIPTTVALQRHKR